MSPDVDTSRRLDAAPPPRPRRRIIVALTTPFSADGSIDRRALRSHLSFLAAAGVDGVLVAGTTGEGPLLADNEVVALCRDCVEAGDGTLEVLAHVGRPATAATVELALRAADAGVAGVAVVTPYFYTVDPGGLLAHFTAVTEALGELPTFVYDIPGRTGNEVGLALARALASHGLAGLKDSTKSLERHLEYLGLQDSHPGFRVFAGTDRLALESLSHGSAGVISAVANARPDLLVRLRDAVEDGDADAAAELREMLLSVREQTVTPNPIAGVKAAIAAGAASRGLGYPVAVRAPLGSAPANAPPTATATATATATTTPPAPISPGLSSASAAAPLSPGPSSAPRLGLLTPFRELPGEFEDVAFENGVKSWQVIIAAADSHDPDDLRSMARLEPLLDGVRRLGRWRPDAVIWACTSGSFIEGAEASIAQGRALARAAGTPASSTSLAFVSALRALDAREVNVIASYPRAATEAFTVFLAEFGVRVVQAIHLGASGATAAEQLTADDYAGAAAALHARDLVTLLPDTATWGFEIARGLEEGSAPILSANQVTLWLAFALLGRRPADPRLGLLRSRPATAVDELAVVVS